MSGSKNKALSTVHKMYANAAWVGPVLKPLFISLKCTELGAFSFYLLSLETYTTKRWGDGAAGTLSRNVLSSFLHGL